MKFCPKCDDRMIGDLCTTCDIKKLPERIYFDEDFKTEEGKFIPIDRNTGRPHKCKRIPARKK